MARAAAEGPASSHELDAERAHALPVVRKIGMGDLRAALAMGLDDFLAKPSHVLFLGILYPLIGIIAARLAFGYGLLPLLYPLVAGISLLGPLVAIGFYELSRRRELGLDTSWWQAFSVVRSRAFRPVATLGLILLGIFYFWIKSAELVYSRIFGSADPGTPGEFLRTVFTTQEGLELILVGNAVGFLFAVLVFVISVISFPMLIDRDGTAASAVITSIRAVAKNPLVMAAWAFIIAAALFLGSLPFFLGLAIVVPILGHASWHLYRRVVAP